MGNYLAKTYIDYYRSTELARLKESIIQKLSGGDYTEAVWTRSELSADADVHRYVKNYNVYPVASWVSQPIVVKYSDHMWEYKLYDQNIDTIITIETCTDHNYDESVTVTPTFEFSSLSTGRIGAISGLGCTDKTCPDKTVVYRYTIWAPLGSDPVDPTKTTVGIYIVHK